MNAMEIREVISDPNVRSQYLAAIRHRGKDVLLKDIEQMVDLLVGYLVDVDSAERKEVELARQVSALKTSQDNIINGLGIKGDGPNSKLVIEYVLGLVAENVALKKKLIFWDAHNPELPYESPEEIASECSINYNEEFEVQVAARMPNRVYRVSESWEHDCKVELVEGQEMKSPSTDAFIAELRAQGVDEFIIYSTASGSTNHDLTVEDAEEFAANLRAGRKG